MTILACDTSFLISLYGKDVHTPTAEKTVRALGYPLSITPLNEFEFENALQFLVFRKLRTAQEAGASLALFQTDLREQRLVATACNLGLLATRAQGISRHHTATAGHRSFDILHIAAALLMEADLFLSFDLNQRRLAKKEGLALRPVHL